jgi:hypothetical protein
MKQILLFCALLFLSNRVAAQKVFEPATLSIQDSSGVLGFLSVCPKVFVPKARISKKKGIKIMERTFYQNEKLYANTFINKFSTVSGDLIYTISYNDSIIGTVYTSYGFGKGLKHYKRLHYYTLIQDPKTQEVYLVLASNCYDTDISVFKLDTSKKMQILKNHFKTLDITVTPFPTPLVAEGATTVFNHCGLYNLFESMRLSIKDDVLVLKFGIGESSYYAVYYNMPTHKWTTDPLRTSFSLSPP